jgi:hypothetical protein
VFDREVLQKWLANPRGLLVVDEVRLNVNTDVGPDGRVVLSLPAIGLWTLSPVALADLKDRM